MKVSKVRESKIEHYLNAVNYSNAYGWTSLNAAFGGDKDYTKMLPFALPSMETTEGLNKPIEDTLRVLKQLLDSNRIPRAVLLELAVLGVLKRISD